MCAKRAPAVFRVEDSITVRGRGRLLIGRVLCGSFSIGDTAEVYRDCHEIATGRLAAIDFLRVTLPDAPDTVLSLRDIYEDAVQPGDELHFFQEDGA